jgi:hypothetical protein
LPFFLAITIRAALKAHPHHSYSRIATRKMINPGTSHRARHAMFSVLGFDFHKHRDHKKGRVSEKLTYLKKNFRSF